MSVLREAFVDELKDLLDAERQLLKALPKMARAAENEQLRAAFTEHEEQTRRQIVRLGDVFEAFEEEAQGIRCKGMEGLIKEAEELIEEEEGDAALIAAAQKAEHYEIAAYGTLASWAVALGQESAAQVLSGTLEEEKETDRRLTMIAQSVVNSMESQKDSEEEEGEEKEKVKPRRRTVKSWRGGAARASRASNRRLSAPRSKRQSSRGATTAKRGKAKASKR